MNVIKADITQPLLLGRQGEHGVTQIEFDLSGYIKTYGDGVAQLAVKRPGDPVEYAAVLSQTENKATWEIGPEWTENAGQGYCYLHWFVDDDHAKSDTFKTLVRESKSACMDVPEPQVGYLDQVLSAGARAAKAVEQSKAIASEVSATATRFDSVVATNIAAVENVARQAAGYAAHPPIIGENGNWWEWNGEEYVDGGKPSTGDSVIITATANDGVLRLSEIGSQVFSAKAENNVLHVNKEVKV